MISYDFPSCLIIRVEVSLFIKTYNIITMSSFLDTLLGCERDFDNVHDEACGLKKTPAVEPETPEEPDTEEESVEENTSREAIDDNKSTRTGVPKVSQSKITVPGGKLGVVIRTTPSGPILVRHNQDSKVKGLIAAGDKILSVNGVDTSSMRAPEVVKLLNKKKRASRVVEIEHTETEEEMRSF